MNLLHTQQTDEEYYQNLIELHKGDLDTFMDPEEWRKLRMAELNKSGLNWSR